MNKSTLLLQDICTSSDGFAQRVANLGTKKIALETAAESDMERRLGFARFYKEMLDDGSSNQNSNHCN
jgi:hypothetical protein